MNWLVFAVFGFIALAIDLSLGVVLTLQSFGGVTPSATLTVIVFLGMFAPRSTALWGAWLLGLALDLTTPHVAQSGAIALVGPHALAGAAMALLILNVRPMLLRRRVLTFAVMTAVAGIAFAIVVVFFLSIRVWMPGNEMFVGDQRPLLELIRQIGCGLYTGVTALILGPLLVSTIPMWAFKTDGQRPSWR